MRQHAPPSTPRRVAIKTLGCKTNQYESAYLRERLPAELCTIVGEDEYADVYVLNTCTVTHRADQECRQILRRVQRRNERAVVIVTGCYAQVAPDRIARLPGIDYIVGNGLKDRILPLIVHAEKQAAPVMLLSDIGGMREILDMPVRTFGGQTRAFLKIQDGCNHACTFCIIPKARGRSRSLPPERVIAQMHEMRRGGHREVILTGIDIGSYGRDLRPSTTFTELLRRIAKEAPVPRVRISSIDPRDLRREIIDLVADSPIFCPHFHLSLQSGDDEILKAMRRAYHTAYFEGLLDDLRTRLPDAAIGIDLMVGFPGEGAEHFERTLRNLERWPLTYFHVFPYSSRSQTPASTMAGQVPHEEKLHRCKIARQLGERKKRRFYEAQLGKREEILVETTGERIRGFTRNYIPVTLPAPALPVAPGTILPVRLQRVEKNRVVASM